jgi:glycosyltransferase involved in cell wall biosynthesis
LKVLLLSAYAARSHAQWQESLCDMFDHWQWEVLSLPPRHFSWRVRGNPLYWSVAERETLRQDWDLLLATSMVDLATLRGLVPSLATVPTVLYFHENQFEYPQDRQRHALLEAQMVSLYSALAADRIAFNSAYNRDTFFCGCAALLARLPDRVPPGVVETLRARSRVLPVPLPWSSPDTVDPAWPGAPGELADRPLRLVWAARFEHDKGGDRLLGLLRELENTDLDYELAVIGQQFRDSPPAFGQIESEFDHRLVQFGFIESSQSYRALLQAADMVISTAIHEFQGLAVLEAVAGGCVPVVPERLVYPEIYPAQFRYASHLDDAGLEARAAVDRVQELNRLLKNKEVQAPDISTFQSIELRPRYQQMFDDVLRSASVPHGG